MGQQQDELLKRIKKLVKKNQDLINRNDKLQKAVTELSEQNEMMKLRLKESRVEQKNDPSREGFERQKKYKMASVLFDYIG